MSITRTAPYGTMTDDSGAGTDGTVFNNAWLQGHLNLLDGRWSQTVDATASGVVTVINPLEADYLILTNTADMFVRSITAPASPAKPGKRLIIFNGGGGNTYLAHMDATAGVAAADRLFNKITGAFTPLGLYGSATYVYQGSTNVWVLQEHHQGYPIGFTPLLTFGGNSVGMSFAVQTGYYIVTGKQVHASIRLALTSKGTSTGVALISGLPFFCNSSVHGVGAVGYFAAMAGLSGLFMLVNTGTTQIVPYTGGAVAVSQLTNTNFNPGDIAISCSYITI